MCLINLTEAFNIIRITDAVHLLYHRVKPLYLESTVKNTNMLWCEGGRTDAANTIRNKHMTGTP